MAKTRVQVRAWADEIAKERRIYEKAMKEMGFSKEGEYWCWRQIGMTVNTRYFASSSKVSVSVKWSEEPVTGKGDFAGEFGASIAVGPKMAFTILAVVANAQAIMSMAREGRDKE